MKLRTLVETTINELAEAETEEKSEPEKKDAGEGGEGLKPGEFRQTDNGYAWVDPSNGVKWWFFTRTYKNKSGNEKGPYWYAKRRIGQDEDPTQTERPTWACDDKEGGRGPLRAADVGEVVETCVKTEGGSPLLPFKPPREIERAPVNIGGGEPQGEFQRQGQD